MRIILALLFSLIATGSFAAETCAPRKAVAPMLTRLEDAMAHGRFVTYQPTSLQIVHGAVKPANEESIRADLKTLRPYFDGLITYTARDGAELIPAIAHELGFKAMIVGVWSPSDPVETKNALDAARTYPRLVLGISLGNEIVFSKRGTWNDLRTYVKQVRAQAPNVALTSTEPFAWFLEDPEGKALAKNLDFVMANVHPVFEPWFRTAPPVNWADYVVKITGLLDADFCTPVLVKETGTPSGPAASGYTPEMQASFWRELERQFVPTKKHAFSYFSAFDAPWREFDKEPNSTVDHPEEAFWGVFDEDRKPKPVIKAMSKLK